MTTECFCYIWIECDPINITCYIVQLYWKKVSIKKFSERNVTENFNYHIKQKS